MTSNTHILRNWTKLILCLLISITANGQTFFQTYLAESNNTAYQIVETNSGYELYLRASSSLDSDWVILGLDESGNQVSKTETTIPGESVESRPLNDGTFLYSNAFDQPLDEVSYAQYDQSGTLLNSFTIDLPTDIVNYESGSFTQLNDGTLLFLNAYTTEGYNGDPTDKHIIFTHYDLANNQVISQEEIVRSTLSFSIGASAYAASDGNVFVLYFDADPVQRRTICKYQTDGTELWCQQVSSLERPVSILTATANGGIWYELPSFEIAPRLDANGNVETPDIKNALQNDIQGPVDIRGIVATNDGYMILARGCPSTGGCFLMSAKVGLDGSILQTNFFDITNQQLIDNVNGIALSDGGFIFSGMTGQFPNKIPTVIRLNENGELLDANIPTDLSLSINGFTSNPAIYTAHSVTIKVQNQSAIDATDVVVNIPIADGEVFSGANPYEASQGVFNHNYFVKDWFVGTLAAGEIAEITLNYFKISDVPFLQYAQIKSLNETDSDSTPGNGDGINENEDDEVVFGALSVDLRASTFQTNDEFAIPQGSNFELPYNIVAIEEGSPITDAYTNRLYVSTDNVFSPDDIAIADDQTNVGQNGLSFNTIIPNSVPTGFYYLFVEIDVNDDVIESNETNNVFVIDASPSLLVTTPNNGQPDLVAGYNFGNQGTYDAPTNVSGGSFTMFNAGANTGTPFLIKYYLSTDPTLSSNDILVAEYDFGSTFVLDVTPQFVAINISVPSNTPSGMYFVITEVDANNEITESNEENNISASARLITINGNSNPCNPDLEDPILSDCPDDFIEVMTSGTSAVVNWTPPTATDNCNNPVLTTNANPGDSFGLGNTIVSYTATDDAGNTANCFFTIVVIQDQNNPCANNLLNNPGYDDGTTYEQWSRVGVDFSEVTMSNDAFDGNQALQINSSQSGGILQNLPAEAGEIYNVKVWIKEITGSAYLQIKFLTSTWQPIYTQTRGVANNGTYVLHELSELAPAGTAYVEVSVLKSSSSSSANFLVDGWCLSTEDSANTCNPDTEAPELIYCPVNQTVTTPSTSAVVTWVPPSANDNCDTQITIASSKDPGDVFGLGNTTVFYTATDNFGNTDNCSFIITVVQDGVSTCSDNLLGNPGFENGFEAWNNRGGGEITSDAFSGNSAMRVCNDGEARVIQNKPVTGGEEYALEFTAKNESGVANFNAGAVSVRWLTSTYQPIPVFNSNPVPAEWLTTYRVYTAPANAAYAEINLQSSFQYCIVVDDVCFSPIDEQTTCQLSANFSNVLCDDNGTPNDDSDDSFTVEVIVNETNCGGGTWGTVIDGNLFTFGYGSFETLGPFDVADGDRSFLFFDSGETDFQTTIDVSAPNTCSNGGGSGTPIACNLNYEIIDNNLVISGEGLNAGHVITKLFGPSWSTLFNCTDDCGNPIVIEGLDNGVHHFSVNLYTSSWEQTCQALVDIPITTIIRQSTAANAIELDQLRGIVLHQVFPVPASNQITLEISAKETSEVIAQVFDGQGRTVNFKTMQLEKGSNQFNWDISELPAGFYQILFNTGNRHSPIRFIKQRL